MYLNQIIDKRTEIVSFPQFQKPRKIFYYASCVSISSERLLFFFLVRHGKYIGIQPPSQSNQPPCISLCLDTSSILVFIFNFEQVEIQLKTTPHPDFSIINQRMYKVCSNLRKLFHYNYHHNCAPLCHPEVQIWARNYMPYL